MNTKIISATMPYIKNEKGDTMSAEELIIFIARVSNPSNQMNTQTSDKLVSYLIKNKHWSPFDMVDITFEVKTSRAIAAQILRHRSMVFQEFSQRYAEVTDMEPIQLRKAGSSNRQSSTEEIHDNMRISVINPQTGMGFDAPVDALIQYHLRYSQDLYKGLLNAGVAKECARMVLPLTTQTTIYMKGSLRSWLTYLNVRLDEHTQLEHRQIAVEIAETLVDEFPMVSKALNQFNNFKGLFI